MTDDALHPDHELASAALDGELDAAGRAVVDADPSLQALARAMADVRGALAAVPPPAPSVRDAAIAAALAEYDATLAPATSVAAAAPVAPNVVTFRRRRLTAVLSAAAAVLLVGVVGVSLLSDDQSDDSSAIDVAADTAAETMSADGAAEPETVTAGADQPVSTIAGIGGAADVAPQVTDTEELLELADDLAPVPMTDDAPTAAEASSPPADTIETTDTVGALATEAPAEEVASPRKAATTVAVGCPIDPDDVFVTDVIWIDTAAAVYLDTVTGEVVAIDASCSVLASVTP